MKILTKISTLFTLLLLVSFSYAKTTGGGDKNSSKEPEQIQQQGDKKQNSSDIDLDGSSRVYENQSIQEVDSTEDDSVSKYNFIFYLLYKFKYNEEQAQEIF